MPKIHVGLDHIILADPAIGCDATARPIRTSYAVCYPRRGLALVDVAPHHTPNAIAIAQFALTNQGFGKAVPGNLPIVYRQIAADELPMLAAHVSRAFASAPPMTVEPDGRWVRLVQRIFCGHPSVSVPMPTPTATAPRLHRRHPSKVALSLAAGAILGLAGVIIVRYPDALMRRELPGEPGLTAAQGAPPEPQPSLVEPSQPLQPTPIPEPSAPPPTPATEAPLETPPLPALVQPAPPRMPPALIAAFLKAGEDAMVRRDIKAARRAYAEAATGGSGMAALLMARTFDPETKPAYADANSLEAQIYYMMARMLGGADVATAFKWSAAAAASKPGGQQPPAQPSQPAPAAPGAAASP